MSPSASSDIEFSLDELFAGYSLRQFTEQYLHRLPFTLPDVAKPICDWGQWESLGPMLQARDADIMIVRTNERYTGPLPADLAEARALSQQGYTILIRHAERHHAEIAGLAAQFGAAFRGKVDAHIYVTPPGHHGFAWHYDAEDVFVLQLGGEKEYALRKNTVNPWPLEETLPLDMRYEREIMPLMRVTLRAGDMLYIPCGYWHKAVAGATGESSISLAVGVMSTSALDVFDLLRCELRESLLWRQRLPISTSDSEKADCSPLSQIMEMLAEDLCKRITSSALRQKLTSAELSHPLPGGE